MGKGKIVESILKNYEIEKKDFTYIKYLNIGLIRDTGNIYENNKYREPCTNFEISTIYDSKQNNLHLGIKGLGIEIKKLILSIEDNKFMLKIKKEEDQLYINQKEKQILSYKSNKKNIDTIIDYNLKIVEDIEKYKIYNKTEIISNKIWIPIALETNDQIFVDGIKGIDQRIIEEYRNRII